MLGSESDADSLGNNAVGADLERALALLEDRKLDEVDRFL